MNQIITLNLEMNSFGITDEGKDVLDPQYGEKVQGCLIPYIDWDKDEEDHGSKPFL